MQYRVSIAGLQVTSLPVALPLSYIALGRWWVLARLLFDADSLGLLSLSGTRIFLQLRGWSRFTLSKIFDRKHEDRKGTTT